LGWRDDFAFLNSALEQNYVGSMPSYKPPKFQTGPTEGYNPWAVSSGPGLNWSDFVRKSGAAAPTAGPPRQTFQPAAPPERFDINLYPGAPKAPAAPQPATKGDVLGSIGGALGNLASIVNPATAIPWVMERVAAGSHGLGDALEEANIPVVSPVLAPAAHAVGNVEDVFLGAVAGISEVVAPVMEALPNAYRDQRLTSQAKVYLAILKGEGFDFGKRLSITNNILPGTARGAADIYDQYQQYHLAAALTMDPQNKLDLATKSAMLLDQIDLPPSVKEALRRNPNITEDQINKLLDNAPEGRQFSYDPGAAGVVGNLGYPLLFYLAEAKAAGGVAGKLRLPPGITYGDIGAAAAGGARVTAIAGGALKTAGTAFTLAAKLQKAALVTGATYAGLSTAVDMVTRWAGADAAVEWFDRINRTAIISDKPSVQLVTGFTVNPFSALGALKTGTLRLASGVGGVSIGKVLGSRFTRYYTHSELLNTQIQRMYKLGSPAEAEEFIERSLGGRGEAFDQVVGLALQTTISRLPEAERAVLAALPAEDLLRTGLKLHGGEVMRLLEKEPELLANRWYEEFWLDRQMPGPFNADVAALISRDYRAATKRTSELRSQIGAVIGRADYVPPRGVALAREFLDRVTDAEGNVKIAGVDGLQDLQRQLPALGRYRQGLLKPGATTVPRSAVETMLERAEADYATLTKQNPVRARTGADPILRPNARPRDYAEALGTTETTIKELEDWKPGQPADRLKLLLVQKVGLDPALVATMAPEQVFEKASAYVDETTKPWLELGTRVASAERQISGVRDELARLRGLPRGARDATYTDRVLRVENQLAQLRDLVRLAADPPVPFSELVRFGKRETRTASGSAHLEEMAVRRADALERLQTLEVLESLPAVTAAAAIGNVAWHELMRETPINHVLAWAGGASPMSAAFRRRFAAYLRETTDTGPGAESAGLRRAQATGLIVEMGDKDAWDLFFRYPGAMARMTRTQQRVARAAERGTGADEYSEVYARAGEGKTGMNTTDSFLEDLGAAIQQREELLSGRSEYNVRRTANMKGEDFALHWFEKSLIADPNSPIYDPTFVAVDHPHNIQRVIQILDRPADLYPGLANVVGNDPVMMNTLSNAGEELGYTVDTLLSDASNADLVRTLLVPEDWIPMEGTLQPMTPLDVLITNADQPAIEAMTEQILATRAQPPTPLKVPLRVAQRMAARAKFVVDERGTRGAPPQFVPEAGFVYHVTRGRVADVIAREGVEPRGTPGNLAGAKQSWWSTGNKELIGRYAQTDDAVVLRTRSGPEFEPGHGAADIATVKTVNTVPPERIEFLGEDGAWHPITAPPVRRVPRTTANRPSHEWRAQLSGLGADMRAAPADAILANPANRLGLDVLSVLTHGVPGRPPVTVSGVLRVLREIENGNAERMGIGTSLQAEGQRVAREILADARNSTKRMGIPPEAFRKGLDPAMLSASDNQLARDLTDGGVLYYDEADPLGSLQYVLKKPPSKAVVLEWSQVPGLAEEFVAGHFEPWSQRVWNADIRKAWGFVFGPRSNEAIGASVRRAFLERAAAAGIEQRDAAAIWARWRDVARASRDTEVRTRPSNLSARTVREHLPADNPLYADVRNIPTRKLDHDAQVALGLTEDVIGPAINNLDYDPAYIDLLRSTDYGTMFREASSNVRRYLKGESIQIGAGLPAQVSPFAKTPALGRALASAYGLAAHNKAVTTLYYWFRFGLDLRFHAMNYFEAQFLYMGRAGLRKGEISTGYLGQTERYLRRVDEDVANNTGYATSRSRFAYAYKTFLKEQPGKLREGVAGMTAEDVPLMRQALEEISQKDPQIADMIDALGESPDTYLKALDSWHAKLLSAVDDADANAKIDEAIAPSLAETPALAEVYGRLADVNKELWKDIRETFYGNPDRSRAERFLNSYLLFWPLSYQIKVTKWLMRVMFDRAGGLQTNAGGAVILTQFAQTHQQLLATDPEYAEWFEKHKTLVFVAQMLVPITPSSMGVSLNPILRDVFFERTKAPWEIGPIYTLTNVLPGLARETYADLYPTLADVPGFAEIYRMAGQTPPKEP
jgi:hypothetical protein